MAVDTQNVVLDLEGPHWSFAVDFYKQPGMQTAFLTLQDRLGLDVIMLLFALYLYCRKGCVLSDEAIAQLDRRIASWRSDVVVPLRTVRRRIKTISPPSTAADGLLKRVAEAAIGSEQIALATLAAAPGGPNVDAQDPAQLRELIARVVNFYASRTESAGASPEDDGMQSAIGAIFSAATRQEGLGPAQATD